MAQTRDWKGMQEMPVRLLNECRGQDLETWMARMIPDGDPMFRHQDEGPDDMAAIAGAEAPDHARRCLRSATAGRVG